MVNFLQRHFQLLWMVKTLITERPTYSQIISFKLEYRNLKNSPATKNEIWKKCKTYSIDSTKGAPAPQKETTIDSGTAEATVVPIDQDIQIGRAHV